MRVEVLSRAERGVSVRSGRTLSKLEAVLTKREAAAKRGAGRARS